MTQRDLADRLNVSDKTVSRWERDEGVPDLSLIPLMADLFDVTCDELLRGERQKGKENNIPEIRERGEKQLRHIVKATLSKYINNTYIAIWISLLGFIAALICNLALLNASLGFFIGEIFFVLSIIFQIIIINKAFSSVEEWEAEEDVLTHFKRKVIAYGERSFGVTMAFVGFTFPLLFVEAYLGLSLKSMIDYGAIGAFSFSLLFFRRLIFC